MPAFTSADPNAYIALGMQSALGTPQTTPAKYRFAKYISGNDFSITPAVVDLREGGDGLDFGTSYKNQMKAAGTLKFNVRPEIAGQFLMTALGGATWDGASLPAGHTFHTNHASLPYGTLAIAYPGTSLIHFLSDVRYLGFDLTMSAGQPWMITAPFTAITFGASHNVALVPSYPSADNFFLFQGGSYIKDGSADSTIEQITVSVKYGAEELQAQSQLLDDIVIQNRDIDVTFVRRYQNSTAYQAIMYGGGVAPTTSVPTGAIQMTQRLTVTPSSYLQVDLGLLTYRDDNLSQMDPNGQTIKETFTAKALHTASAVMSIVLRNSHASAYTS